MAPTTTPHTPHAMASSPPHPADIVTNPDRAKPDDVLRVLSPLRPRRTPVLVNAPVVSWRLGAPALRPLPSFSSVLSDSVVSEASAVSSEGSTVRALRGALRALSADAESAREGSMDGVLVGGGEGEIGAVQGEGLQTGSWEGEVPLSLQREGLLPPILEENAPLPPPHRIPPTFSATEVEVEQEEEASTSSLEYEEEEEDVEEGDTPEKCPAAKHQWNPHCLSPVTEATESELSRGPSMMSMLSVGNALEVGVARRVRFAAVGGVVGRGVEEEEEGTRWSQGRMQRHWNEGRIIRRRPAFYAAYRDDGEIASRSHQNGVAPRAEEQEKGRCRLHTSAPGLTSPARAGIDVLQATAAGQTAASGETANGEKPADAERGEEKDGRRGFCIRLGLDKFRDKAGRLRRKLNGRVGRMVTARVLGRVL